MRQELITVIAERDGRKLQMRGRADMHDAYLGRVGSSRKRDRGRGAADNSPFVTAVRPSFDFRLKRLIFYAGWKSIESEITKCVHFILIDPRIAISENLTSGQAIFQDCIDIFAMISCSGKRAAESPSCNLMSTTRSATPRQLLEWPNTASATNTRNATPQIRPALQPLFLSLMQ